MQLNIKNMQLALAQFERLKAHIEHHEAKRSQTPPAKVAKPKKRKHKPKYQPSNKEAAECLAAALKAVNG